MQSTWDGPPPPTASEEQLAEYLKRLCSDVTLLSNKDGFFAQWLKQIQVYISDEFVLRFGKLNTDYERIEMIWKVKPVHSLKVAKFFRAKDEKSSQQLREEGNQEFKGRNARKALLLYSQAVTKAPSTGSTLGLAFANRSAALATLMEYRWCLRDCRSALLSGYGSALKYKLLERAGYCYEKLHLPAPAAVVYTAALLALPAAGLSEDKAKDWQKSLQQKLDACENQEKIEKLNENGVDFLLSDPENISVSDWKGVGAPTPTAALHEGPSTSLPSASSAVHLTCHPEEGRSAVAGRDVPPGAVLVDEAPLAAILARDKAGAYCSNCHRRLVAPVPCPSCCGVAFCCHSCRQQSKDWHRWECPFLELLNGSGISLNGYLALRLITSRPLQYFTDLRKQLIATGLLQQHTSKHNNKSSKGTESKAASSSQPRLFMPSPATPHDNTSYLSVYRMVGLEEQRDPLDFVQRTLMAILLLKILQRTGYFGEWDEDTPADADASDEELFIGALLLRNLQVLQFNAHEVSGMTFLSDPATFKKSKSLYLGIGVYPTVAFFNHSCFPAVTRYFIGNRMVVCSIRGIPKGEMLAENYGPIFTYHTKEQRQRKLLSRYWFTCHCEACSGGWGTYPEQVRALTLKCPHCSAPLRSPDTPNASTAAAMGKKSKTSSSFECEKCNKNVNFQQMTSEMVSANKCYSRGIESMDRGDREESIRDLFSYVSRCRQHALMPLKELNLALEALRLIIAARGTCALVNQPAM